MKRVHFVIILIIILICSIWGLALAAALEEKIKDYNAVIDWYSIEAAENIPVPAGLTAHEEELFRIGYASGHYDALHPEYVEGMYVLNKKTKKYHLSNCPSTLQIETSQAREHSYLTPEELEAMGYKPCGQCHLSSKNK